MIPVLRINPWIPSQLGSQGNKPLSHVTKGLILAKTELALGLYALLDDGLNLG